MVAKKKRAQSRLPLAFGIGLVIVIVGAAILAWGPGLSRPPPDPHTSRDLVFHWHAHIAIMVNGVNMTIPGDIGVPGGTWQGHAFDSYGVGGYAPLHTHDTSGIIHIETSVEAGFSLKDFFYVWGETLTDDPRCVLDYCQGDYTIFLFYDGDLPPASESWEDLALVDGTDVFIRISTA